MKTVEKGGRRNMPELDRLIYVPTLRCNCACKHCGQSRYFPEEECDPALISQRLLESDSFSSQFSITGGEPFLKNGIAGSLAKIIRGGGYIVT